MTEEVKIVFTRLEKLQTDLGSRSTDRTDSFQVPTVWGSVAMLSRTIDEIKVDINKCPSKAELTNILMSEVDRIEARALNTVNAIIVDLESKVATILVQNEATKKFHEREILKLSRAIENSQITNKEIMLKLAEGASILKDEIDELCQQSQGYSNRNNLASTFNNCRNYVPIPDFNFKIDTLEKDLDGLRVLIAKLISASDGDAIKSFGLGFKDPKSSNEWVDANLAGSQFGLVVDAHLVFEHLFYLSGDNENSLKQLNNILKLELSNMTQGLCIQSFETRIPKMFSKSTRYPKGKGKTHFDGIPNYAAWENSSEGTKELIAEHLATFQTSHQNDIEEYTLPDSKGRDIASKSLVLAVLWIQSFVTYIDDTYKGFMRQHTFTAEKAWELTTQLGRRIFIEVSVPRNGVLTSFNIGKNDKINKLTFWPIVRCNDIMKTFKDARFEDHPTIAGEYVKFLAANSGSEVITKVLVRLDKQDEEIALSAKRVLAAEKVASSAMNLVDGQKRQIQDLQKLVGKGHDGNNGNKR